MRNGSKRLSLLLEYKLIHARMEVDLSGGGRLEVDPTAHYLVLGLSYSIGRQGRARE